MRTRRSWFIPLAAGAALLAACNGDFTGNVCGNVLFLKLGNGHSGTLNVGETVTLVAQRGVAAPGVGGAGCTVQNLPSSSVDWSSADTTVISIPSPGQARGVAPGKAAVSATQGGQTASLNLTVRN